MEKRAAQAIFFEFFHKVQRANGVLTFASIDLYYLVKLIE